MEKKKTSPKQLIKLGSSLIDRLKGLGRDSVTTSRRSIRSKIMIALLVLGLIPLIIMGLVTRFSSSNALMSRAFDNLESIRSTKASAIKTYFEERQYGMGVLVNTVNTLRQEAFDQLEAVLTIKKTQIEDYFLDRMGDVSLMATNPTVVKALMAFQNVGDNPGGPKWKAVSKIFSPWLEKYKEDNGYYNLYLVSAKGQVLYTVEKESDLGQSLRKGKLKTSPAGKAFKIGLKGQALVDFELYEPSGNEPRAFLAAPIKIGGTTKGVFMVQIPTDHINTIMQERTGLGNTGETYLIGSDKLFRSESRFIEEDTIINPDYKVNTDSSKAALSGMKESKIIHTYRGKILVLSSYAPLDILGLKWAIIAEISAEEAFTPKVKGEAEDYFTKYKEAYGFYNMYLFDGNGLLFYSVEHEPDYGTNILTGPYKDTSLGRLVEKVVKAERIYNAEMADFKKYGPSGNTAVAFLAQPVVQEHQEESNKKLKSQVELIIAVQMSLDHINYIMQERTGLGKSSETYLVGPDRLWRSDSWFIDKLAVDTTVMNPKTKVNTEASKSALSGKSGTKVIDNYLGNKVLSSWLPVTIQEPSIANPKGIKWALISEIGLDEVRQPITRLTWIYGGVLAAAFVLVILVAFGLSEGLTTQVRKIMDLFSEIGMGNFKARTEVVSRDELGSMADSLNAMLDNTLTLIQTRDERDAMQASVMKLLEEISGLAEGDLTRRAEVSAEMTGAIADSFNAMAEQLSRVVKNVKETTIEVSSTSQDVTSSTKQLAKISEAQAKQVSDAISAITEMASSIQQVSENASQSAKVSEESKVNAKDGADAAKNTNKAMQDIRENVQETAQSIKRLGERSQEIGNIVQLINDIADRTSILALNASIQAAMAGDAGRGFAVVAEEVQRLAERSTNATKQIDTLIKNIQGEINEAGTSMEQSIQQVVEGSKLADNAHTKLQEIESVSTELAESIQSISTAASEQAKSSENISHTMEEVGKISSETSSASSQTSLAMVKLTKTSDNLAASVEAFKVDQTDEVADTVPAEKEPETKVEMISAA